MQLNKGSKEERKEIPHMDFLMKILVKKKSTNVTFKKMSLFILPFFLPAPFKKSNEFVISITN